MHTVKADEIDQDKVNGIDTWSFLAQNPEDEEIFNRAMTNLSLSAVPPIVDVYDFSSISKLVDIAGGHGFLLAGILKANPQMRGVLFDRLSVIVGAAALLEKEGGSNGVELASGDFFESVPVGADAYIMKHIIHDWDDRQSIKILQNIRSAMNENGKVLICEIVVPEGNEPSPSKIPDIKMLVNLSGKERTEEEFKSLLESSGFRLTRITATKSPFSVIASEPV